MSKRDEILPLLPQQLRGLVSAAVSDFAALREIRLRVNQPVILLSGGREIMLNYRVTARNVREAVELISSHSLYAFEEDVKRGFLTVPGGHRVGLAGRVIMEDGRVAALRNISFLNIRISHEVKGSAEAFLSDIRKSTDIYNTLILSGPGGGKTTLLRDLVRLLSYGGKNISVIDERSEIAGCYQGIPGNDLGPQTDVLDGCPKAIGCRMALRSLAPDVLAVDEIGGSKDLDALSEAAACGCRVVATIHANGIEDLAAKPFFKEAWENRVFERFLVRVPAVPVGHHCSWRTADERGRWI